MAEIKKKRRKRRRRRTEEVTIVSHCQKNHHDLHSLLHLNLSVSLKRKKKKTKKEEQIKYHTRLLHILNRPLMNAIKLLQLLYQD